MPHLLESFAERLKEGAATARSLLSIAVLVVVSSGSGGGCRGGGFGRGRGGSSDGSGNRVGSLNIGVGVTSTSAATGPDDWTGHWIVLHSAPNAEVERWVILLVTTWELDRRTGSAVAAAGDLDLGAAGKVLDMYVCT
jgi:hypothetical protein